MKTVRSVVCLSAISVFLLGTIDAFADTERDCSPFSGTNYGALFAEPGSSPAWHLVGDFTIGHRTHHARIDVQLTSLIRDFDIWQGSETWTFDFGHGNTVQLMTSFVTEHMTNADGVFHIREVGTFSNGQGALKHAYGNLTSEGPFGPAVVLHDVPELPEGAIMYFVAPSQGMICGYGSRDHHHHD